MKSTSAAHQINIGELAGRSANNDAKAKLESFRAYRKGWASGEGEAFSLQLIERTLTFLARANREGFVETDAFPGLGGEIRLTLYQGNHYFEFTFLELEVVDFVYEFDDEELFRQESLTYGEAISLLSKCRLLGCYSGIGGTGAFDDSKVWLLNVKTKRKELLSFWNHVLWKRAAASAPMQDDTTVPSAANPQSSGISTQRIFQETLSSSKHQVVRET